MSVESKVPVISMRDVTKAFPGVLALDRMTIDLYAGEVHVLMGENGAGKSTLMKILSGVYQKDSGNVMFDGVEKSIHGVKEAQEMGVGIIHQELNLLPHRTVYQNIFLGREIMKSEVLRTVDNRKMAKKTRELLTQLGIDIDPSTMVKGLSIAQRQMVEVAKALSLNAKVLIMDEPTSSLTTKEIEFLFGIIERLKKEGVAIVYISHRMEELKRVGDKVTVMRDGKLIGTKSVNEVSTDEIIEMMIGRKIEKLYSRNFNTPEKEVLRTEKLCGLRFRDVSISVRSGEIVSLAGLVGAGRTEIAKAIFGYDKIDSGEVYIEGKRVKKPTPKKMSGLSVGFLPEDRRDEGLVLNLSVEENTILASLKDLFKNNLWRSKPSEDAAGHYTKALKLSPPDIKNLAYALSGGNQQKVVLAKWLCKKCRLFIFDEPTRGVDVGSKSDIYNLMDGLVKEGAGILMISSDMPEVIGLSDRVYVVRDGAVVVELQKGEINQKDVGRYAIGGTSDEK